MKVWTTPVYVHIVADTADEALAQLDAAGLSDGPATISQGRRRFDAFYINVDGIDVADFTNDYETREEVST